MCERGLAFSEESGRVHWMLFFFFFLGGWSVSIGGKLHAWTDLDRHNRVMFYLRILAGGNNRMAKELKIGEYN